MSNKTPEQLRSEFATKSQEAKRTAYKHQLLNSLTEADRESVKLLASLDDSSGGNLAKLVQAYNLIKQDTN